jgi:hypothetical protein
MAGKQPFLMPIGEARWVGNAWTDGEYTALFCCVSIDITRQLRPWSDYAHFTAKNVPQLREFIEFVAPEKPAHACHSSVA